MNSFNLEYKMDFEGRILLLLLLFTVLVSGLQDVNVSCPQEQVCALGASPVNITCSYSNIPNITTGFWFSLKGKTNWREKKNPEDLLLDSDYAGRIQYRTFTKVSSTLTITDLRARDSGEYRLVLITDKGEKFVSRTGINLTVTDLQVTRDFGKQMLTCNTSCQLTGISVQKYFWYNNGQYLKQFKLDNGTFPLDGSEKDAYSCSLQGHDNIFSPPLCLGSNCWSVTYPDKRVCVLKGPSVEFAGNFLHPVSNTFQRFFWHSHDFYDLKMSNKRVTYQREDKNGILKMDSVEMEDSGEYRLRVLTNNNGQFSGKPGVVLNVTDLQISLRYYAAAPEERPTATLTCITSCTLSNSPTYVWYKNGHPVTTIINNKLHLISSKDSGNYSCAVSGREDLRSPEQTVTLPDGGLCSGCEVPVMYIIVGVSIVLAVIIIAGALWMWRKRSKSDQSHISTENPKPQSGPEGRSQPDDVHYSSIHFLYSTQGSSLHTAGEKEQELVQYAEVNYKKSAAAT